MKPIDGTDQTDLAGNFHLLLIGIVALYQSEVLAKKLVVIEIALDEFPLILTSLSLALVQICSADHEFGQYRSRLLGPV